MSRTSSQLYPTFGWRRPRTDMRQEAMPLPPSIPECQPGHRPQLVTTDGAPHRYRIGGPAPTTVHISAAAAASTAWWLWQRR
ncbi:hypothetical protein DZD52_18955 [Xanthomonas nasturtii]|uniref:Uncharacterized protein n=1 Tax=Xanthomonas nasturtii TaxID=1843581 RepID=A0A3E1KEI4_9XANT|nr:hypothetical protein DZD52_18955 [Xanthomonas nasturtii]